MSWRLDNKNTKSLLHFDISTAFVDESGKTWTGGGNAQIVTAQSKFGGRSLLLPGGAGDRIDTPGHADFNVGSGDFAIDLWIRRNTTGFQRICAQCDNAPTVSTISWFFQVNASHFLEGGIYSGATPYLATSAIAITNDSAWHHVAMVRGGNTITLYTDGVGSGTVSVTGITANNSAYKATIGQLGEFSGSNFNGWIDEWRFSRLARWTANFTPPAKPYQPAGAIAYVTGK